jgi:hypothetical protein
MLITQREMKNCLRKKQKKQTKKQIKVGTWEYRQLQDYRKRESGWGKALVFHFTSLSTKKKTLPSN